MASFLAGSCGPAMGLARSFRAAKALLPASASVACRKWSGACELMHIRSWGQARGRRASEPGATQAKAPRGGWDRLQGSAGARGRACRPDLIRPLPQGPAWGRPGSGALDLPSPARSSRRRNRSSRTSALPSIGKAGETRAWAGFLLFWSVRSRTCIRLSFRL